MNKILRFFGLPAVLWAALALSSCQPSGKYSYETVPNDPLKAKIYTLPNGLKVYMTVNKEQPRIQTYIAVRAGGKNDPAETTGLAHYFEHLMFKGTKQFGTMNYEAEEPLLNRIEELFEIYRHTTDEAARKAIYHEIDSVSYEASRYAIPNEYDKLMSSIGANGTNAYTSYDQTVYVEDIPSNQLENWAKIQADRFENNVIRGFHTELEAVYEEKNMSLTKDNRKVYEAMLAELFKHHPYGTQTVLGTQEQLKNPSITNIKEFFKTWYVPNNIAICLSGDFDPDHVIDVITEYFGDMKPNDNLPTLHFEEEEPITAPRVRDVLGLEAEHLWLAWRFPGANSREIEPLSVITRVLSNGQAGLMDLDLNHPQRVLGAYTGVQPFADYTVFLAMGYPMPGQTLEEVRSLMLEEVGKLRRGEFEEEMLEAIINEYKLSLQKQLEDNSSRADMFVDAFINGTDWADEVASLERLSKITKQEIVDFANRYLTDSNYVCINKRQAVDPSQIKISKPEITPILTNRDTASAFLREVQNSVVAPIEPVFVDFEKDMSILTAKQDIPVLYKKNETNDLFVLTYLFDMGNLADKTLGIAAQYLDYLGTETLTPEAIKSEFYRLGCTFSVNPGGRRTYVTLTGLNENMPAAVNLFETLMAEAKPDATTYMKLVEATLQSRMNNKANQLQNFGRLRQYAMYGPAILKQTLSNEELATLDPQALTDLIKTLNGYEHRILYYGPGSEQEVVDLINKEHRTPETLQPVLANQLVPMQQTDKPVVYMAPYNANNIYMSQFSCDNTPYDPATEPIRTLYNEYFGGGMNSIVFQEMRESRGLAYSAWASLLAPNYKAEPYYMTSYIATQNDKLNDATATFNDIINMMPQSETAFQLAKEGLISRLRTERTTRDGILWAYLQAQDLGETVDGNIKLFNDVQNMTLQDVLDFQQKNVKGRTYYYSILGDKNNIDMNVVKKLGTIKELTTTEIFGY